MHKQTLAYFRKCEFERRWLDAESDCVRRVGSNKMTDALEMVRQRIKLSFNWLSWSSWFRRRIRRPTDRPTRSCATGLWASSHERISPLIGAGRRLDVDGVGTRPVSVDPSMSSQPGGAATCGRVAITTSISRQILNVLCLQAAYVAVRCASPSASTVLRKWNNQKGCFCK